MRFPHSDLEKEFADIHTRNVFDHPANTKTWMQTVTNKALKLKMKGMNEESTPLSSSEKL